MTEIIEIASQPVAHMASSITCPHCHNLQDVERVFTALAITESPEHISAFISGKYSDITSVDIAQQISSRINLANPQKPYLICDDCGQPISLAVRHETQRMEVPVLLECPSCNRNIDLRLQRDKDRVHFTREWPNVPFINCLCKQKVLLPVKGRQAWRNIAFKGICCLRKLRGV